jgi:hypothetical protein
MKRAKKPRAISSARARQLRVYAKERRAFIAANPWCLACQRRQLKTIQKTEDIHHAHGRICALLLMKQFWKPVCRPCHDWLREPGNLAQARRLGLMCAEGDWNRVPR